MSFTSDLAGATTDLEGLRAFDSNGDGILSNLDDRFADFWVWRDANGNGKTEAGEILTFSKIGLSSISLTAVATAAVSKPGDVAIVNAGSWTRADGREMGLADAMLTYFAAAPGSNKPSHSTWLDRMGTKFEFKFSKMFDIGEAMSLPTSLADIFEQVRSERLLGTQAQSVGGPSNVSPGVHHSPGFEDVELSRTLAAMTQDLAAFGTERPGRIDMIARPLHHHVDLFAA